MKILVLGGTGVAGRSLLPLLVEGGHDVVAHVRSADNAGLITTVGASPVLGDAFDSDRLREWMRGCDAVVDLRVSIPPASRAALGWSWRQYARLRDHACGQVVDAAIDAGVPRVVRDTVTMVYADGGDAWLDETQRVEASGSLAANLAAERHLARLTAAGGSGVAVRFGGFYGPADAFSHEMIAAAGRGRGLIAGDPGGYTSAVHTDDIGSALLVALSAPAGVYNAVDDEPMRRSTVLEILASAAGRDQVTPFPSWTTKVASAPMRSLGRSHRVSNRRLMSLGWQPSVPSRRTGWPDAFAAHQRARALEE